MFYLYQEKVSGVQSKTILVFKEEAYENLRVPVGLFAKQSYLYYMYKINEILFIRQTFNGRWIHYQGGNNVKINFPLLKKGPTLKERMCCPLE